MRSTGEVLGLADSYGRAFFKAQEGTGTMLPLSGAVLITVAEQDRAGGLEAAKKFTRLGFKIFATEGTQAYLDQNGVASELIKKMHEGRPNIADAIKNDEIQLVVNTPIGRLSIHDDSYIRKAAIKHKIPYITTTAAANAAAEGIAACRTEGKGQVRSLQEYHQQL
jgi:carbamoyl-phosphate synthase large subunit